MLSNLGLDLAVPFKGKRLALSGNTFPLLDDFLSPECIKVPVSSALGTIDFVKCGIRKFLMPTTGSFQTPKGQQVPQGRAQMRMDEALPRKAGNAGGGGALGG